MGRGHGRRRHDGHLGHLGRQFGVPVLLLHPDDALDPAVQFADVRHELVVELEAFGGLDEQVLVRIEGACEGLYLRLPGADEVGDYAPRRGVLGVHLRQRLQDVLLRTQVLLDDLDLGLVLLELGVEDPPECVLVVAAVRPGLLLRHQLGRDVVAVRLRPQLLRQLGPLRAHLVHFGQDPTHLRHVRLRLVVQVCHGGDLPLQLVEGLPQQAEVVHVNLDGVVQRQVRLGGHLVGVLVLLQLQLQLRVERGGPLADDGLVLPLLLLLVPQVLPHLAYGRLHVGADAGDARHRLLQLPRDVTTVVPLDADGGGALDQLLRQGLHFNRKISNRS